MRNRLKKWSLLGMAVILMILVPAGVASGRSGGALPAVSPSAETAEASEVRYDKVEDFLYLNLENMGPFLDHDQNNPHPATQYPAGKQVFRIYEVIPHEICSVFPYLVEWGSKEEYDKNVPIGYEALMAMAGTESYARIFDGMLANAATDLRTYQPVDMAMTTGVNLGLFYTAKTLPRKTHFPKLEDYNFPAGLSRYSAMENRKRGFYYRETEKTISAGNNAKNGYFEFVGEGKGMYYIASSYVVGHKVNGAVVTKGIHTEVEVIPVSGGKEGKGEMYVGDQAYYWAKDHNGEIEKPDFIGAEIKSQTGFHYSLSFTSSPVGSYRADTRKGSIRTENDSAADLKLEYLVSLAEEDGIINRWTGGFAFMVDREKHRGQDVSYSVKTAEVDNDNGKYVRIESENPKEQDNADTLANVPKLASGYFRQYQPSDNGAARYQVEFTRTDPNSAKAKYIQYYALEPESWTNPYGVEDRELVSGSSASPLSEEERLEKLEKLGYKYSFVYQEEKNDSGRFDVPFLYGIKKGQAAYAPAVMAVTDGKGRYAMTSTEEDSLKPGNPVYITPSKGDAVSFRKDFTEMITRIDFLSGQVSGKNPTDNLKNGIGVVAGGPDLSNQNAESGGWVFVEDGSTVNQQTRLSEVHKSDVPGQNSNDYYKDELGKKIYVQKQDIQVRYYCRDGFFNNEWFKLLSLARNPLDNSKAYKDQVTQNGVTVGYDVSKSGKENLDNEYAQEIIKNFDQNYRIEIIQVYPGDFTVDMVKDADLIYISKSVAVNWLKQSWGYINEIRKLYKYEPLPDIPDPIFYGYEYPMDPDHDKKYDITGETLLEIYKQCIYNNDVALIVDSDLRTITGTYKSGTSPTYNLEKLTFLMNFYKDPKNFAYFMPTMFQDKIDNSPPEWGAKNFSKINNDGTISVYWKSQWPHGYNIDFVAEDAIEEKRWEPAFFFKTNYGDLFPSIVNGAGFVNNVYNPDNKTILMIGDELFAHLMQSIVNLDVWKLIQEASGDDYSLTVRPVNAEKVWISNGNEKWVIYGNEFDPKSFDIYFEVYQVKDGIETEATNITPASCSVSGPAATAVGTGVYGSGEAYHTNVREGFILSGDILDPAKPSQTVTITARDASGKQAEVEVEVVVREAFSLN